MSDTPRATVSKSFRLTKEDVDRLKRLSKAMGCSQTDAIRRALQTEEDAIQSDTACDTPSNTPDGADALTRDVVAALMDQLREKDRQIGSLQESLDKALDAARGAQALHAREVSALESSEQKERRWRWPWSRGNREA